mgnify:CR=1 FL=1
MNNSDKKTLNDIKRLFFAHYMNQEIAIDKAGFKANVYDAIKLNWLDNFKLELKSLSKITDEDAEELIKLKFKYDKGDVNDIISMKLEKSFDKKGYALSLEAVVKHKKWADFVERIFISDEKVYSFYIDYLRSKGYAVSFMEYTIEDLVNLNWVTII